MIGNRVKSSWLGGLIDFVFPPLCLGCAEYTENEHFICDACLVAIDSFEQPFCLTCMQMLPPEQNHCSVCGADELILYAYGNYVEPLEKVIIQFKFKGITRPSEFFADEISKRFGQLIATAGTPVLVPIPLHRGRESFRGYNQAAVFAADLAKKLGLQTRMDIIERVKKRKPQARLNHDEREANIRGVYQVITPVDESRPVMLVDDVVTSGATIREAVRVLKEAGLEVAGVICVAHAL